MSGGVGSCCLTSVQKIRPSKIKESTAFKWSIQMEATKPNNSYLYHAITLKAPFSTLGC